MNAQRAIWRNFKAVVLHTNFLAAVLIIFGVLFAECIDIPRTRNWPQAFMGDAYFFNIALNFGYYIYAAPLACAFAASGLFVDDYEAGFYRLRLVKSGKRVYKNGLFFGATLGGGLALFAGVMLFAGLCALLYGPTHDTAEMAAFGAWLPILTAPGANWWYMIAHAAFAFVFGAIWSGVGLTFSVVSPIRYVGCLVPFICCFCAQFILPASLQPLEMLLQMRWSTFTFAKLFTYQAVLFTAVFFLYQLAIERRLCHEK